MLVRSNVSIALGALFIAGCIFPSFDDMQGGGEKPAQARDETPPATESSATTAPDAATKSGAIASPDAAPDASATAPVDAGADAATKSPGAGKIACGSEQCPVAANSHCCSDYVNPQFYCSSPSHTIGWCTGGGGKALFCDEKDDCPGAQVCCLKNDVATCSAACDGGQVL